MSAHTFKHLLVKSLSSQRQQQQPGQAQGQSPGLFPPPPAYTAAVPNSSSIFQPTLPSEPHPTASMAFNNYSNAGNVNGLFAPGLRRTQNQNQSQIPNPASDVFPEDAIDNDHDQDYDHATPTPSINITISTPIIIHGDSNTMSFSPADIGAEMAKAIIGALRDSSMSVVGIPMIDQDGVPRPINVNVTAGVEVKGSGNKMGQEASGMRIARGDVNARSMMMAAHGEIVEKEQIAIHELGRKTALENAEMARRQALQGVKRGREENGGAEDGVHEQSERVSKTKRVE